jgi:hypothetical protein
MSVAFSVAAAFVLTGILPFQGQAQDVDSRWLPWLGCWEASEGGTEVPMLCISPLTEGQGVELSTWADSENISTEMIYTDGVSREVEREGCVGSEEAFFSEMGQRIYLSSDYICEGGSRRGATGVLAFANPMEWLDIKVVEVGGQKVPMVLRYRLARSSRLEAAGVENVVSPRAMSVKAARIAASARLTPADLVEATGKVDTEALEALIAERGVPFNMNSDVLVAMADAGVQENLIDLAVAMSYPDRFVVEAGIPQNVRQDRTGRVGPMPFGYMGRSTRWSFWNPYFYDPFYYSPYGYAYSPYYYNYGWYSGYYRPTTVVVGGTTNPPGGSGSYSHGRVISGRGYSRGGGVSSSRGSQTPSTRSAPSTRSGGSSVSSSGARRSGSTSRSTGRTAKRRGGGGGLF